MNDKKAKLQHDADAVILKLEEAISKIKTACNEPDSDTADKLFDSAMFNLMMNIASYIMAEKDIPPVYQKIRGKYTQPV